MNNEKRLSDTFLMMIATNISILVYYSLVCPITIMRIVRNFNSYTFVSEVGRIPWHPMQMPLQAGFLLVLFLVVSVAKDDSRIRGEFQRFLVCMVEIAVGIGIVVVTNFYYNGILLLVLADLIHFCKRNGERLFYVIMLTIGYTFGRFEIMPFADKRVPFSAYLDYYNSGVKGYFSGIESILVSLNILLFIYYLVLLFTGQRDENKRILNLYDKLKAANNRLREYALELEHMTEIRERNRLAREIHDTLGHTLTGIIMGSEAAIALLEVNPAESKKRMEITAQSARDGLNDVRQSIHALRPDALEKHSLEQALNNMIANFHLTTSADIDFRQEAGRLEFAEDEEDLIYRVLQECMTNAIRHGHATQIMVHLSRQEDVLMIDIRDNGLGCKTVKEGFGLYHMQERLELIGGSLTYGNRLEDLDDGEWGFYVITSMSIRERESGAVADAQATGD